MCMECRQSICPSGCPNAPEPKYPICPFCGEETDTFSKREGEIVGCPECLKSVDAWEEQDGQI